MSKQTETNLLIGSSQNRYAGLYQHLLKGLCSFQQLSSLVLEEIKTASAFRQLEKVQELAIILLNTPIEEYQLIGKYYYAWCHYHKDTSQAGVLENVAEQSQTYKAQALLTRAAIEGYQGNTGSELYFYAEALKSRPALSEYLRASIGIAVVKSKEGFHDSALKELESCMPLIRYAEPVLYFDYLNSYAVELCEVGRKYEARNIIQPVIASPFAYAYPEWRETADELKGPNRSFARLDPSPARMGKLLSMPVVEHTRAIKRDRPASVLSLQEWKAKTAKDRSGNNEPLPVDMNGMDMVVTIMSLVTQEGISEKNLRRILHYVRKVLSEPDQD